MAIEAENYLIADNLRRENPNDSTSSYLPYYPDPIPLYRNSTVTPLIDGNAYYRDLYNEIKRLADHRASGVSQGSNQRIYIASWVFDKKFKLTDGKLNYPLVQLLKDAADDGVDVRVMLWVNENAIARKELYGVDTFTEICISNINTCADLRNNPNLTNKALLNVLDHYYGSSHMKIVFIADYSSTEGSSIIAYTGGIDLTESRGANPLHEYAVKNSRITNYWHDIQVRLEGDSTVAIYEFFKQLWDELVTKKEAEEQAIIVKNYGPPEAPPIWRSEVAGFGRTTAVQIGNTRHYAVPEFAQKFSNDEILIPHIPYPPTSTVQSLRTVPDVANAIWHSPNYSFPAFSRKSDLLTAENGIYEVQLGYKTAILAAQEYIYIENYVTNSRDLLAVIKDAIIAKPNLKVIFLTASPSGKANKLYLDLKEHLYYLRRYLYEGLTPEQKNQIVVFKCSVAYIHSKVMIVDDKLAIIGSANFANRSLYTDFEHVIAFIDNEEQAGVKMFRQALWAEHFRMSNLETLRAAEYIHALNVWNPAWGIHNNTPLLPSWAEDQNILMTEEMNSYNGISFSLSLIPLRIFSSDVNGNQLDLPGPESKADSGGANYLIDAALPSLNSVNLTGGWIYTLTGPSSGQLFYISSVENDRLNFAFAPSGTSFDETTTYLLLYPAIKRVEVPEQLEELTWTQEVEEIGSLP